MPPKKTAVKTPAVVRPKTVQAKTVRAKTPAAVQPKTVQPKTVQPKSVRSKTPALVEGEAKKAAAVRIPVIDLNYETPKASADAQRRIPELKLGQRRGWKGEPLPFDTEAGALAWGMSHVKLGESRQRYQKSRKTIQTLRRDIGDAANGDGPYVQYVEATRKEMPKARTATGQFAGQHRVQVPGLTTTEESGTDSDIWV